MASTPTEWRTTTNFRAGPHHERKHVYPQTRQKGLPYLVDDVLDILTNNGIRSQGYADDIVIITVGKFENTPCDNI